MGRRLNVSTPTVINTELVPLDESFYLDVDGQMEQWYYDNTEQYAPNRKVTPLLLVPVISAFDKDTSTSYAPVFNTTQWFANEWNESQGKYVETEITNQVDSGSADYVIQGNNLLVKKNVSYSHAVSIRCVATYIDPRDSGVTYAVEDSINLTTNRTADIVFPEVDIISPSGRAYNPLVDDENSQYDFKGVTTNNPVQPLNTDVRRYSIDVDGTEEILNSGEAVAPIMDIRYGENQTMENQEFMYRQTAGGTLVGESIDKAYIERIKGNTVAWNQTYKANRNDTTKGVTINVNEGAVVLSGISTGVGRAGTFNYSEFKGYKGHTFIIKKDFNLPEGDYIFDQYNSSSNNNITSVVFTQKADYIIPQLYIKKENVSYNGIEGHLMLFDLTRIYGTGNEPTTVAQFEADYERWLGKPLTYEEPDAGSLRPVLMNAIQTKGANNSWTKTQNLPITTLTGKLDGTGESVIIFPDGLKRAGNVQDEIFVEDGVVKAIKRVGKEVRNGANTESYTLQSINSYNIANFYFSINARKSGNCRSVCDTLVLQSTSIDSEKNRGYLMSNGKTTYIRIESNIASTNNELKTFLSNKPITIYYELAEPQTYVLDPITDFVWYGIKDGQEVLADTLPWYVSGQGTDNLVVDAMYGKNINVVLRCKMMDGETLSPSKAYATLNWRTPDIETFVQSDNGGAVRSDTEEMTFDTIVNINGEVLSDALKRKHLAFNWKIRKNNTSTEIDKGWGQRITIDASDLRNVKGSGSTLASTLVSNEVYLKGAYEEVTDNGEVVTYNGEKVYDRPVD